jgi:hypothetical protein
LELILLGKTREQLDDKRGCMSPWEVVDAIFNDNTFAYESEFKNNPELGNNINKSVDHAQVLCPRYDE